jgi:uncharacterized protein (TIGR04255 family)
MGRVVLELADSVATIVQLARAPITEALVDLRLSAAGAVDAAKFESLREELADRYPKADERRKVETVLGMRKGGFSAAGRDLGFYGLFLSSASGKSVVQFRPDGFTFNQLGHYTTADDLFEEALDLWSRYVQVVQPAKVIRVGLRYINKITLPIQHGELFSKYLAMVPEIPGDLPQSMGSFLTRYSITDEEDNVQLLLTQNFKGAQSGPAELLLDIDVYLERPIGIETTELLGHLQRLRRLKNSAFFSMVTDETVKLFL